MDSTSVQVTFRTSQTLGNCLNLLWLSTIRDGRLRLRRRKTLTSEPPSRPASVKPTPRSQAHLQALRLPEPINLRFPMLVKGTHSLIYLPLRQWNHLSQPFQITISRRQSPTLS